jgi:hypothetical protein
MSIVSGIESKKEQKRGLTKAVLKKLIKPTRLTERVIELLNLKLCQCSLTRRYLGSKPLAVW